MQYKTYIHPSQKAHIRGLSQKNVDYACQKKVTTAQTWYFTCYMYMYYASIHKITSESVELYLFCVQSKTARYGNPAHAGDVNDVIVDHVWTSCSETFTTVFRSTRHCVRNTSDAAIPTSDTSLWTSYCLMNGWTVEWRASNRPCPESVCLEYALSTAGSRQNLVELGLVNTAGAQRVENQFPVGSYQLYDWGHCLGEISYSRCCRTDPCTSWLMRSRGPGVWSEERLTGFKPTAWCKGMRMRKLSSMSFYNILH